MSRGDPKRLRLVASSPLQRRVLETTAQEEPSPEERDRMARALGVSAAAIGVASGAALAKTAALASKAAGASVGTTATLPWIAVGVVGLVLAGAIAGTQAWKTPVRPEPPPAPAAIASTPGPAASVEPAPAARAPVAVPAPAPLRPELAATTSGCRARIATTPLDLREQNALVDAARDAMASGAAERTLALLRRYRDRYPRGIFRPEAAALKIEAMAELGRGTEARALADRFVAEYGDGPLTDRVRRVAGLAHP